MARSLSLASLCLLFLAISFGLASSARILDEADPSIADLPPLPISANPSTGFPSGQAVAATEAPVEAAAPVDTPAPADAAPVEVPDQPQPTPDDTATPDVSPVAAPDTTGPAQGAAAASAATGPAVAGGPEHPALSFFMHDVLGGSHATGRIVTGIIATSDVSSIPFSQPNNQVFPLNNGVPLNNQNLINNNNVPFLAGLTGRNNQQAQTVIQNTGNNNIANGNNNNQAFVTPGQLPGATLQKLMFGSITVIDDELTEGHELGSAVIGRGQGFYLASSLDGESHTMAFTTILHAGDQGDQEPDTLSFFGVHRTASPISQIAIVGGTGKYENAKGYATIETLPQVDQHTTDGIDTIAHMNVFIY